MFIPYIDTMFLFGLVCTEKVDNGGITKNTIKSSTSDASAEEG